jgi:hypothetical protein
MFYMGPDFMEEMMIREKIEKLTEILFCAETSGPETLRCLQHWFKEIRQWAGRKAQSDIIFLSHAASNVVEKMILDQTGIAASSMALHPETLSRDEIRNWLLDELIELSETDLPFTPSALNQNTLKSTCVI